MHPGALLLGQAPWPVMGAVLERLDANACHDLIATGGMPTGALVAYVLAHGHDEARAALAANPVATPDILGRLAEDPSPPVARQLLQHPYACREFLISALHALPPGTRVPGTGEDGGPTQRAVYLQIEAPDPDAVADALAALHIARAFPAAGLVLLRGCVNLWRLAGRDAVAAALRTVPRVDHPHTDAVDLVADALEHPHGLHRLDLAVGRRTGTREVLRRLDAAPRKPVARARESGGMARLILLAPHEPLDWDLIVRTHADSPIPGLFALNDEPGCPPEIATSTTGSAWAPASVLGRNRNRRREARAQAMTALRDFGSQQSVRLVQIAYAAGLLTARTVFDAATPAVRALGVFDGASGRHLNEARSAIGSLTKPTLGTHVEAWIVALTLLPEFEGTVPELLATARAAAA